MQFHSLKNNKEEEIEKEGYEQCWRCSSVGRVVAYKGRSPKFSPEPQETRHIVSHTPGTSVLGGEAGAPWDTEDLAPGQGGGRNLKEKYLLTLNEFLPKGRDFP